MNSNDIKKKLTSICPLLRGFFRRPKNIWLTDEEYLFPSLDSLVNIVSKCSVSELSYKDSVLECEEFSLFLMSDIRKFRRLNSFVKLNWPFGMVIGYQKDKYVHNMNICLTLSGIVLIEPQTNEISNFDIEILNPFFIWM